MNVEPPRRACEALLWFILFFAPAAFGSTELWSRAVLECAIFVLAAMCALRRDFSSPLSGPFWGLCAVAVLGVLQFIDARPLAEPASLLPFTLSRSQTLGSILQWAAYASLLWASSGILRWEGGLRRASWAIVAVGLFIAIVGILQRGQGNAAYYGLRSIRHGRPFGPFTNYHHAASWMAVSASIAAGLFTAGFGRIRAPLTEFASKQVLTAFILVVHLAAMRETASRGAIQALIASSILTSYLASGALSNNLIRRVLRVGLILAGISLAVMIFRYYPNWLGIADGVLDNSAGYRVSMYRSGLRVIADFPVFGVGLGSFDEGFRVYQEPLVVGHVEHIHSSWLEVVLESGLLGLVFIGAVVLAPLAALGARLGVSDFSDRALASGYFAALCSFALHGLIESSFQIPANAIVFIVCTAGCLLFWPPSLGLKSRTVHRRSAALAGLFLGLALWSLPLGFAASDLRLGASHFP